MIYNRIRHFARFLPVLPMIFWAGVALAQAPSPKGVDLTIDYLVGRLECLAGWFGGIAMTVTIIMLIVYGIMFLLSGDDSSKFTEAKKALGTGIMGAFVIFGVYVIIASVAVFIGNTTFTINPFASCQ